MAKAAATWGNLFLVLSLFVLPNCLEPTLPTDTHSLSCKFIAKSPTELEQPWCKGQCLVDGVHFLPYNDYKATPLGDQGKKENAIKECVDLSQKLEDIFEELRKQLLNMEPVADKTRDHHTLQIFIESQYKGEQLVHAVWNFISEQYSFHYYPLNKTWGVTHDKARGTMKQLEINRELAQDLETFSRGDSGRCLKQLLKHWKEMPRSTSRAPDITQLPSTTQLPPTINITQLPPTINITQLPPTTKFQCKEVLISLGLIFLIAIVICIWMSVKRKSQGVRNLQMPMNCSMNCCKPQRKESPMEPSGEFPNQATKMLSQEDEPQDMKRPEEDIKSPGTELQLVVSTGN